MKKAGEDGHSRFIGHHLCAESSAHLFVVGAFDNKLFSASDVIVSRCSSLLKAEQLIATGSGASVANTLVLALCQNDQRLENKLGRAIRAFSHRVVVRCQPAEPADLRAGTSLDTVFFSLGFRKLNVFDEPVPGVMPSRWYEYQLSSYKSPPDWLSSRFWANPERFDMQDDPDEYGEYDWDSEYDEDE